MHASIWPGAPHVGFWYVLVAVRIKQHKREHVHKSTPGCSKLCHVHHVQRCVHGLSLLRFAFVTGRFDPANALASASARPTA
jgi:hypothetical protein